jgi:hypothetical protein
MLLIMAGGSTGGARRLVQIGFVLLILGAIVVVAAEAQRDALTARTAAQTTTTPADLFYQDGTPIPEVEVERALTEGRANARPGAELRMFDTSGKPMWVKVEKFNDALRAGWKYESPTAYAKRKANEASIPSHQRIEAFSVTGYLIGTLGLGFLAIAALRRTATGAARLTGSLAAEFENAKRGASTTPEPPKALTPTKAAEPAPIEAKRIACPACHHSNDGDAKFCDKCGARIRAPGCPSCGLPNAVDALFCKGCGAKLS